MIKLKINLFVVFVSLIVLIDCSSYIQNVTKDKCNHNIKTLNQTVFNSAIEKIFFGQFSTKNYKLYEAGLFLKGELKQAVSYKLISFASFPIISISIIIISMIYILYSMQKSSKKKKLQQKKSVFYGWEIVSLTIFIFISSFLLTIIVFELKVANNQASNQLDNAKCAFYNGVDVALNGDKNQNWIGFYNIQTQIDKLQLSAKSIIKNFESQKIGMRQKIVLNREIIQTQKNIQKNNRISIQLKLPQQSKIALSHQSKIQFSQIMIQISDRQTKNQKDFYEIQKSFIQFQKVPFNTPANLIQEFTKFKTKIQQFNQNLIQYQASNVIPFQEIYSPLINIFYDIIIMITIILSLSMLFSVVCGYHWFNRIFKIMYFIHIPIMFISFWPSYNYLHYGIFIHSTCQIAQPYLRSAKFDKFGQVYSPFHQLDVCFKSDPNILLIFNYQNQIKAMNTVKQFLSNFVRNQDQNILYYDQWIKSLNTFIVGQQHMKLSNSEQNDLQAFKSGLIEIKNFHTILLSSGKLQQKIIDDFQRNIQSSFTCTFLKNQVKFVSNVICTNLMPIINNLAIPNLVILIPLFLIMIGGFGMNKILEWLAINKHRIEKSYVEVSGMKNNQHQDERQGLRKYSS